MGKYFPSHKTKKSQQSVNILKLLFLTATLSFVAKCDPQQTTLEINKISESFEVDDSKFKYFKLNLDKKTYDGSSHLIIKAKSVQENPSDPDIFISKINKFPSSYEKSEWVCSSYGQEACSISNKNLTAGQDIYIAVRCDKGCIFAMYPQLVYPKILDDGEEEQVDFQAWQSKIFQFYIPKAQSKEDEYQVKSIVINALPISSKNEKISIAASINNDITPNAQTRRSVPGWRLGQTLRLSDNYPQDWCTDCYINILIDVNDPGIYSITAKTNVGTPVLTKNKRVDDVAFYGERNCYKYYVQSPSTDIHLKVAQFSGMVAYSFNPRLIPSDNKTKPAFSHEGTTRNSVLVISAGDRALKNSKTGDYYICIDAYMTSTYSLIVTEVQPGIQYEELFDGYDQNGEVAYEQKSVYMYKTPDLQFATQDISLEFLLSVISGPTPIMFAGFCTEKSLTQCQSTAESYNPKVYDGSAKNGLSNRFKVANLMGKDLNLIIDHDEKTCQNEYNGECYYVIVIQGQGKLGDLTKYSINIMDNQQNYYILQESKMINDYTNSGFYRYYQFSLINDKSAKNVTFKLNTHHGDADLYVSRLHQYPSKNAYEKSSVKTGQVVDIVSFDDSNVTAVYQVAVYSFEYSTYSLIVTVDRPGQNKKSAILLQEGITVRGSIHNEDSFDLYELDIKQSEGYERDIKIQTTNLDGEVRFYLSKSIDVSEKNFQFGNKGNTIHISKNDPYFNKESVYYIAVYPEYEFWRRFTDDYYKYLITYSTQDTHIYLYSGLSLQNTQKADTKQYFKHLLPYNFPDLLLSLTPFSGEPFLYVSLDPENQYPSRTSHDMDYQNMFSSTIFKGKSLQIKSQVLMNRNRECARISSDPVNATTNPCAIYIGVTCVKECKYALKLNYESHLPQLLIEGVPEHGAIRDKNFNYHYLIVRENKFKEVFGILQSLAGNADLYVKLQPNPSSKDIQQWILPSQYEYDLKSEEILEQDTVRINSEHVAKCFNTTESNSIDKECAIIFGVYANDIEKFLENDSNILADYNEDYSQDLYKTKYNLIVYTEVMFLVQQMPITTTVEQNEYNYYIFDVTCDECGLIISVQTFGSGDPDVFVNYGDERMPTKNEYDFSSSTAKSELLSIDLNSTFFKEYKLTSMLGKYVIGVYGVKKSMYTIIVSQQEYPISTLIEGYAQKHSQEAYEIQYFMFFNYKHEKDFKILLNVQSGIADIYMTTFVDPEDSEFADQQPTLTSRLPKSKRDAQFVLENVNARTSTNERYMLVLNQDRNYCEQCYFLIGVVTHDQQTDYSIMIHSLDADFTNSQLLKMGDKQMFNMESEQVKYFKFIIDTKANIQIIQKLNFGTANTIVSFDSEGNVPLFEITDTNTTTIKSNSEMFQTEKLYYIKVQATSYCEASFMVVQDKYIQQLSDGIPQRFVFHDYQDVTKYMTYSLPDGDFTLNILVRSLSEDFIPRLYIAYYENLEKVISGLEFPPGGQGEFVVIKNWDKKLNVLSYQRTFSRLNGGKNGMALSLYDISMKRIVRLDQEVQITVSTSSIVKLEPETTHFGQITNAMGYQLLQIPETYLSRSGYILFEFSECIGEMDVSFYNNAQKLDKGSLIEHSLFTEFGNSIYHVQVPLSQLYAVIKPRLYKAVDGDYFEFTKAEYMAKARFTYTQQMKNKDFRLVDDGKINFRLSSDPTQFDISWGQALKIGTVGTNSQTDDASYIVLTTKNPRARLDSVCALKKEVASKLIIASDVTTNTTYHYKNAKPGDKYYFNVIAKVKLTGSGDKFDFLPYNPMELRIPKQAVINAFAIILYVIVFLGFAVAATYYFRKTKSVASQLEYEMADVRSMASTSDYEKAPEQIRIQDQQKYQSLVQDNQ